MNWKNFFALAGLLALMCSQLAAALPAETNTIIHWGEFMVLPGDTWKYHDQGVDLGTSWRELNYNDSSWPQGPTQIGYGDGDEMTIINIGPDAGNRYPTAYFRRKFTVDDASRYTNFTIYLLRDDGAVVYLNGVDVFRSNMPTNTTILYSTLSTSNSLPTDETTNLYVKIFFPTNLLTGTNVMAVEVHQNDPTSTDSSFDFGLVGLSVPTQGAPSFVLYPTNVTVGMGSNVVFRAAAAGARPMTYQWQRNGTNISGATNGVLYLNNTFVSDAGQYRCIASNETGVVTSSVGTLTIIPSAPYDLAKDYTAASYSNGVWSVGFETNLGVGFTFNTYRRTYNSDNSVQLINYLTSSGELPLIGKNANNATATGRNGAFVAPKGTVWIVPGTNNSPRQFGIVRFTADKTGVFWLGTTVRPYLDGDLSGDNEFHVLKNGTEIFGVFLPQHGCASFVTNLSMTTGDTIDFAVGRGLDGLVDGSGLKLDARLIQTNATDLNPPVILAQPLDKTAEVNGDTTFSVTAVGAGPLSYQWLTNGTAIANATNSSLALSNVQFDTAKSYSVKITNSLGSVTSSVATLIIRYSVSDLASSFSLGSNPNGVWSYGCETNLGGVFEPFIFSTNQTLSGGAGIDVWANGATNTARINFNGSAVTGTSDTNQGIYPPGTVWFQPGADGRADSYGVIRFTVPKYCEGTYEVSCTLQSYLQGPSAGDTDFHIQKDGVEYFCRWMSGTNYGFSVVTNITVTSLETIDFIVGRGLDGKAAGSGLKIQATINRINTNGVAPFIQVQPATRVVSLTSNVTFSVLANSTLPIWYQWYWNDIEIPDETSPTLTLRNVQYGYAGNYSVSIVNELGSTVSSNAVLFVKPRGNFDLARDFSGTANPNVRWSYGWMTGFGPVINVMATSGSYLSQNGVPFRFWQKNTAETNAGIYYNPTLDTGYSDNGQGVYPPNCLWMIPGQEGHSDNFALARFSTYVINPGYYQVWALAQPQLVGTNAGDNEFHILKGGVDIAPFYLPANTGVAAYSNILWLKGGESLDFAVGRGEDKHTAGSGLKIEAVLTPFTTTPLPLTILASPQNITSAIGSNVTFGVAASGPGPFRYQWFFNGTALSGSTNVFFTVTNISPDKAGIYSAAVTDTQGTTISAEGSLTILDFHDGFTDNFDPEYNPFLWSSFGGTVLANNYGGAVSGPNSLWFALNGTNSRYATTRSLDTTIGGFISFYIRLADLSVSNWYRPTLTNEQVVFEYTTNSGSTWTVLSRYDTTNYMVWTSQLLGIPPAACTTNTMFRWRQLLNSGDGYDNWALDNVQIFLGPVAPQFITHPASQTVFEGSTVTLSTVVLASTPAYYQWYCNNVGISGANGPVLTLYNVGKNNAGIYTLTVRNDLGEATSQPAELSIFDLGPSFQILTLETNHPAILEHNALTGDDRGGIAVSANSVFVTGDNNTARFNIETLSGGASLGRVYDGMLCDLQSTKVYLLANGTNVLTSYPSTITTLREIDGVTGQLTDNLITLSTPINLGGSSAMMYSGYGRAVIHSGNNSHIYHILLPYGTVMDLGTMSVPSRTSSESWATWGVVEYFGGQLYLVFARNSTTIARMHVPTGLITTLASFNSLGDMASFTVSPYLDRWYFHYEGSAQFGGNDETVGFADATFDFAGDATAPTMAAQPRNQIVMEGQTASFRAYTAGARPFSYQWFFNGVELPDATEATLNITAYPTNQGNYSVRVSNDYGWILSSNASLTTVSWGGEFKITSLTSNNAKVVEHNSLTSSDRGGLALSYDKLFYSGYNYTYSFSLDNLSNGVSLGSVFRAQVSNLRTEMVYSLGNGTNLITTPYYSTTVTTLLEHDPITGKLTGRSIPLSSPISWSSYYNIGLFSGFDRIVIHTYSRAYMILLPSGLVVDLGAMSPPSHASVPYYLYWGIAEFYSNTVYLVTASDSYHMIRTRVPDGQTETIATFDNLSSYMFAISAAPYLNRWYFHHRYQSQFSPNGSQTLGFADATFTFTDSPRPPEIISQPFSDRVTTPGTVEFSGSAMGSRPLLYQWQFNGQPIPNATNTILRLSGVTLDQAGQYSLLVSNQYGTATTSNATLEVIQLTGDNFQIASLTTSNVSVIEHGQYTGDNRGAIAASSNNVFYSGDAATAGFNLGNLTPEASFECCYDALISDLKTERMYSLGSGMGTIPNGGGMVTTLLEHDPQTGLLNGNHIDLSNPITLYGSSSSVGLFAGYGRIVLLDGTYVYNIDLPSGIVAQIGRMPALTHYASENWAYWGIAEYSNGIVSIVYVRDNYTIVRTRVPDGLTTNVATFTSLGYMSGFTLSPALNRWYFHHSSSSQFRSGDETIGFADASFIYNAPASAPQFVGQPSSQTAASGSQIKLASIAKGSQPLYYQWFFEGAAIEGATDLTLTLPRLSPNQSGRYWVQASNTLGVAVSLEAILNVITLPGDEFYILELSTNNSYAIEVASLQGDNRGPIAVSSNQVFSTGDSGTARFDLLDLSGGANMGVTYDAIASDLKSGMLYSLGSETDLLSNGGGLVTRLYELDTTTGLATGNTIPLSTSIMVSNYNSSGYIGIFSGYGRIVLHNMSRVYDIALPSGTVTDLGAMGTLNHMATECWAYWGVAELIDGVINLVYVKDYYTIARTRVPDGLTTNLLYLYYWPALGYDMTFSISPFVDRWYFHCYSDSLFRTSGDETLGFAEAKFSISTSNRPPMIARNPSSVTVLQTNTATFQMLVIGSPPLSFQWLVNGQNLPNATNSTLTLTNVMPSQNGLYSAVVSNTSGCVTSQPARLNVWAGLPPERNFRMVSFLTNNLVMSNAQSVCGYERGGIAVSSSRVFHTGSSYSGRFNASDLGQGTSLGTIYDGLAANLRTEQVYVLASGNTPIVYNGTMSVNALLELDPNTGALTGNRIPLSSPINVGYNSGIFSGYDMIVIYSYQQNRVYLINLPSGEVVDLGYMYLYSGWYYNWAYWGIAEQFDNTIYLVYVQDNYNIVRVRVPDGAKTTLNTFGSLGTTTSIAVSPSRGRWYFHGESYPLGSGYYETIGFADALFQYPPSLTPVPNQTILEDTSLGPVALTVYDAFTNPSALTLTGVSANTNLIPNENIVFQGTGSNRTVTITPLPNLYGSATITLTVSNANSLTCTSSFLLTVLSVNDGPILELNSTQDVVLEDSGSRTVLNLIAYYSIGPSNENSQWLTFNVTNNNSALFFIQPSISSFYDGTNWIYALSYTLAQNAFGTSVISITLSDDGGTNNGGVNISAPQQFAITVLPVNDAPSFSLARSSLAIPEDAGPQIFPNWVTNLQPGPLNEAGQTMTLSVTTANSNLFASSPAINASGTLTFTPAPNSNGVTSVSVLLRDSGGTLNGGFDAVAHSFILIIASVNDAPIANPQSVRIAPKTSASILLTAFDAENDALTFAIDTPPLHGTLSGTPPYLLYQPYTNYHGPDSFTFIASDAYTSSTPASISITVTSSNRAPVAVADLSSPSMLRSNADHFTLLAFNNNNATMLLDASRSSDADADALTCYWWVENATNSFAQGQCVTNLISLGACYIVLGVYDGEAVATNRIHLQIITPSQALQELTLKINTSPIARLEQIRLLNRLKLASQYFDRNQPHDGLNQLRLYIAELRALFLLKPRLAFDLGQPAEDIIQCFVKSEIAGAIEKIEQLKQQIEGGGMTRYNNKILLGYLREVANACQRLQLDDARKYLSHFQSRIDEAVAAPLAAQFLDSAEEIIDCLIEISIWDEERSWEWDDCWQGEIELLP
jgi:hypothetical protein